MLKTHLYYAALAAIGGALGSVIVDKAFERRAAGKPMIPSGLTAVASGLLPLASAVLKDIAHQVDTLVDGLEGGDKGDSAGSGENDEPVTGSPGPRPALFASLVRDANLSAPPTGTDGAPTAPVRKEELELEPA